MGAQLTELMWILLYLFLTLAGGALVAVLAILVIILIAALGTWLALKIMSFRSGATSLAEQKGFW
jgi:uncharacterized membrane protein YjgN (DUF898 family)